MLQQRNLMRKQSYDPICLDTFDDHSDWILEDSLPFLTPEEVDALRNDLANMSIEPTLNDLDQLNLEDDQDNDGPSNNAMEDMDTNQNEENVDQAPNLPYEDDADFELTLWT
ncbi:uncharacterized protein LOC130961627 [Arachis stenosperma]|uniref:uncharacterized protein LOC130961627 n=1 Tax=Arachis stenosperma TaxID=217475 RepID=UPI0025AC7A3B|nr:uncharacterized protein LOC130961627 [Arachis stenosperma]